MGAKTCIDCEWAPICKIYESANLLMDDARENNVNMIEEDNLFELIADKCIYYTMLKKD